MSSAREENRKKVEEDAEVNMTPMIDVVFLLIIFFLCIDFKILEAKLPAYLPKDVGSQTTKVDPQEKLRIKIVCDNWGRKEYRPGTKTKVDPWMDDRPYRLVGHEVHYQVGPERVDTLEELKEKLEKLRPNKLFKDPDTGEMKPVGVVVEPGYQTTYGDVAPVVDTVIAAEFPDINFGGGLGSRRQGESYAKKAQRKARKGK